jgi:division protein CdvB (Snf7/Vps24/ESCRT-III family)
MKKNYTNEDVIAGLQLKDDLLFSAVFKDLEAAQELVRTVLDDETIILKEVNTQYDIANVRGHSVRLDMYGESTKGELHNVETQIHFAKVHHLYIARK